MRPLALIHNFAATCSGGGFFGFPTWYKYLTTTTDAATGACTVRLSGVNDIWLIVAAIIEILLRVAGIMAVAFVIFGGFQYVTSQSEPDALAKARQTIVNALIGLVLAILATTIVNFVAGSIH
jgi:ABC-type Fe3+ transport system permease subunit